MKKRLIGIVLAVTIIAQMGVVAFATPVTQAHSMVSITLSQRNPKADQIVWYERICDGKIQQRAWNATKGYWIGEWVTVGYV